MLLACAAVTIPLNVVIKQFTALGTMYNTISTLSATLSKDIDSELQKSGELSIDNLCLQYVFQESSNINVCFFFADLPIYFLHLNLAMKSADAQYSAAASQMGATVAFMKENHPKPILFTTISGSDFLSSFEGLKSPTFGASLESSPLEF